MSAMPEHAVHPPAMGQRQERTAAVRRALLAIILLNAVVVAVKLAVGIRTGSLTVIGAALESTLDMLNSAVGMFVVTVAARGPDEDHPYGHGKFETLGALGIVVFLSITCFELLRHAVLTLWRGGTVDRAEPLELGLLAATAGVNIFVVWYERKRGRELHSPFLLADAEHTRSDLYVTGMAVGSLLLATFGIEEADPVLAMLVAVVIIRSGYQIFRASLPVLVDERAVEAGEIRRILDGLPRVNDVRDIRSRTGAAGVLFAEITIVVAGGTSVADAHELADAVESRIEAALGPSQVSVHVEPS